MKSPTRHPFYVVGHGHMITRAGGRLVVKRDGVPTTSAPLGRISEVVVFGNVGLTTPALNALLAEDVPLVLLSVDGRQRGRLEPPRASAVDARRHQFDAYLDPVARLAHARTIVRGKIHTAVPCPCRGQWDDRAR